MVSTLDYTSSPEPLHFPQRKNLEWEKETSQLSKELEILSGKLIEVQRCLSELTDSLWGKKSPPVDPHSQDLPHVYLSYQKRYVESVVGKKQKRERERRASLQWQTKAQYRSADFRPHSY